MPGEPTAAARPVLIYDGDCGFCTRQVTRLRALAGERVEMLTAQSAGERFPILPQTELLAAIHLVSPDGRITRGAAAILAVLALSGARRWRAAAWGYSHLPGAAAVCEWGYRRVARNRHRLGGAAACAIDAVAPRPRHVAITWLFLRLLAVTYLAAFASLDVQIIGLVGSHGISPAERYCAAAEHYLGPQRCWELPTICWWTGASDATLTRLCRAGEVCAGLLLVDVAPALMLLLLWGLYRSLMTVGQGFLEFQWDLLLLEAGFAAIWLAPLSLRPRWATAPEPRRAARWLMIWLLLRLMFSSGVVKLSRGDPTWHGLSALDYHYWTQPIPNAIAWFVHHEPGWLARVSVAVMFAIELGAPLLAFGGRRARQVAAAMLAGLQVLIGLTGNYGFFNFLSAALCLLLLDDAALPGFVRRRFEPAGEAAPRCGFRWPGWAVAPVAAVLVVLTLPLLGRAIKRDFRGPRGVERWVERARECGVVGNYGLFAVMTTTRPEIVVEGSRDGRTWQAYGFRYKPGDVRRAPPWIGLHMPRLDWQMWFAALGDWRAARNRWFESFCTRLLEGEPDVVALLEHNPFADAPPRFVRATLWEYRFSTADQRAADGAWWVRDYRGFYGPIRTHGSGR
ncbi:MAG: lipase maturation factor family protein [Phycisphaerae bacterium]